MRRSLQVNGIAAIVFIFSGLFCFLASDLYAKVPGSRSSSDNAGSKSSLSQGSPSDVIRASSVGSSLSVEEIMDSAEEKALQPRVIILDSLAGGMLGGMAGSALTRNLGFESHKADWKEGFGILDIVLIFACIHGMVWLVRRRGE